MDFNPTLACNLQDYLWFIQTSITIDINKEIKDNTVLERQLSALSSTNRRPGDARAFKLHRGTAGFGGPFCSVEIL